MCSESTASSVPLGCPTVPVCLGQQIDRPCFRAKSSASPGTIRDSWPLLPRGHMATTKIGVLLMLNSVKISGK